jgi:predicted dinucleotide-binding enzyme
MTKIGIIGDGNVGSALARGLQRAGHEVRAVGNDSAAIRNVAGSSELVVLAIPFGAIDDVVKAAGEALAGKTVIDVTNALDANMNLAVGFTTSGAEELQRKLPKSRVVKAFNTVFAQHMDSGKVDDQQLTAFVASDDEASRKLVIELAHGIGFDPVDVGPLKNAEDEEGTT